jgi:hypothetical protein
MIIDAIGRRLRLAVIGGGPGSVIGEVHRIAARLDGYRYAIRARARRRARARLIREAKLFSENPRRETRFWPIVGQRRTNLIF